MNHFDNILSYTPDLSKRNILDVGAGKGKFVIEGTKLGYKITGVEYNIENVNLAKKTANNLGIDISIIQGEAEHLPFPDKIFDFINFSEVIEHVNSPEETLREAFRVLNNGGDVYISVPCRYSWYDPHFHLAFVNWLPRNLSDFYISVFSKHKDYKGESGHQRLSEMHYYTYNDFVYLAKDTGFQIEDIRKLKIKKRFANKIVRAMVESVYFLIRSWYFRAFHFKLHKI